MAPAIVPVQGEIDLHKRPPFGSFGFAHKVHAGFGGRAVGFVRIAGDARADDVFPGGRTAAIARNDVVQV